MRSLLVLCKTASSAFLLMMLVMRTLTEALYLKFEPHSLHDESSGHCRTCLMRSKLVRCRSVACVMCPSRDDTLRVISYQDIMLVSG